MSNENILSIKNLNASFFTSAGEVQAVRDVSFEVKRGEILGIVGESGSGKSATMLSVMGLLGNSGKIKSGEIFFKGQDLSQNIKDLRGKNISMIFQDPMTSLNPVLTIGYQLKESLKHYKWQGDINARAIKMLERVGIVPAEKRIKQYPHEFSGGQRQRIMIAMSMMSEPELLIADEPTTALDVTVQAQILKLIKNLQTETGTSVILITHDLGVIAGYADRVLVMYGGKIMEEGTRREIFYNPAHPYTKGLLRSVPDPDKPRKRLIPIEGQPPNLLTPPKGCPYAERCPQALKECFEKIPVEKIFPDSETHKYFCWRECESC
ncbi:MAG: ABC transporter ATP-binding protein [Synergistaceae bacterium]|nr:ABC transporter ATP-binding protein [Synergistaceae bacterium]